MALVMSGCMVARGTKKRFITELKNRLRDCCCQGWFSHMAKSERFDLYSCFQNALERERYLEVVQSRVYKTALARFRMVVATDFAFQLQRTNDFALSVLT